MLKTLKNRFLFSIGASQFSNEFLISLAVHALYILATSLSSLFVSIFLFKNTNDFILVSKYNLCVYVFEIVGYLVSVNVCKKVKPLLPMKYGMALLSLGYIILLVSGSNASEIYILIAALCGAAGSSYWLAYTFCLTAFTTPSNRQGALAFQGLIVNSIGILAPLISGFITGSLTGYLGYTIIFLISGLTFLVSSLISRNLKLQAKGSKEVHFKEVLHKVKTNKIVRYVAVGEFFRGFRDSIALYYINVLVYATISSEVMVGFTSTFKSICIITTYFFIGKITKQSQRRSSVYLVTVFELIMLTLCFTTLNPFIIMIYGGTHGILLSTTYNNSQLAMFFAMENIGSKYDVETIAIRHIFLDVGRIISVTIFLFMPTDVKFGIIALGIVALINLLAGYFFDKCETQYRLEHKGE